MTNQSDAEKVFEDHRYILEYRKITETEDVVRYILGTPLEEYEEYMFDYGWLEVREIVTWACPESEKLGTEDTNRGILARLTNGPDFPALGFVVEVEK